MIINVRGTNGSGKSTIIKQFIQRYPYKEIFGVKGSRFAEAYQVRIKAKDLYVLGPYGGPTGGLDALGMTIPDTINLIDRYQKRGHVLFEGVIISTTFGAFGAWLQEKHRDDSVVAFLDTPLDVCLKALSERQSGHRGQQHVASKHAVITKLQETMRTAGLRVESINRETGFDKILGWLK